MKVDDILIVGRMRPAGHVQIPDNASCLLCTIPGREETRLELWLVRSMRGSYIELRGVDEASATRLSTLMFGTQAWPIDHRGGVLRLRDLTEHDVAVACADGALVSFILR